MDVAAPTFPTATTREQYNPHPGGKDVPLACPSCGDPDHLSIVESAPVVTQARFWDVGATRPEVEFDADTEAVSPGRKGRVVTGIDCSACKWAVRNDSEPYKRLRPAEG